MIFNTNRPCARCEALPTKTEGPGRLYLWLPLGHSSNKIIKYFERASDSQRCRALNDHQCVIEVGGAEDLLGLGASITKLLTSEEVKDTRALFVQGSREPQFDDFARLTSLRQFATITQAGWLVDMLAEERVTSHFQPIVHASDTTRVFAQEALFRGVEHDGTLVPPSKIFDLCRDADLLFQVDLLARRTAVREAGRHKIDSHLFINFNPSAIYDPAFCLRSTVHAISEANLQPENIVFEVIESDRSADSNHLKRILEHYREAGFAVALDDLGAGYSSLNLIHQLRPDYIKLDMELIRGVHLDPCKAVIAEKLLEIAQALGIKTVAEGVETPEELEWVRLHGADFVQGYLIAKPSATPLQLTPGIPAANLYAVAPEAPSMFAQV